MNIQNTRLREALIRLREQTALEKIDTTKQLREAEKDATKGRDLSEKVNKLQEQKSSLEEQVTDLKEMVEQGSAFEAMIEDLSDRVLELEDVNVTLQATVRELEDGQDLAAELEEVQADELKALMRDVEGRDSVIRNLEEAIKMQRRREEDFQRTVAQYRNSVETLQQEKTELMTLQQGGEGEKNDLLVTSQKALARAAQLVADAASARKRAAQTAFIEVEAQVLRHLVTRLESVMPTSAVAAESAAIKGEMLLCEIVSKASKTLHGVGEIFTKTVRGATSELLQVKEVSPPGTEPFAIPDASAQAVETMLHQSRFAQSTVDASSKLIRILAFGQWPDVVQPGKSAEIGSVLVHSLGSLNATTTLTLKLLKEEGVLSPHQSNLGAFQQSLSSVLGEVEGALSLDGTPLVDTQWQPPGWNLLRSASSAKYYCLGASAAVSSVVAQTDVTQASSGSEQVTKEVLAAFKLPIGKFDQIVAQVLNVSSRLGLLDTTDDRLMKNLELLVTDWNTQSSNLFSKVEELFESKTKCSASIIEQCCAQADATQRSIGAVASALRAADAKVSQEAHGGHPLSAEVADPWKAISALSQRVRSVDGDVDDVNFVQRAHIVEARLSEAIDNEPKLVSATMKIGSLEKHLSSRSKEIAMQNARLSELERVLAKNNTQVSLRPKTVDVSSAEEVNSLKQEIRVLTEAMEVLQSQTDEYEAEIRMLKDPKSPMGRKSGTPRKGGSVFDYTATQRGRKEDPFGGASLSSIAALEAALFRPALEHTRANASRWKAQSMAKAMADLPPLNIVGFGSDESKVGDPDDASNPVPELATATKQLWMARTNISVINLSDTSKPAREQLHQSLLAPLAAESRVRNATALAKQWMSSQHGVQAIGTEIPSRPEKLVGRVKFPSQALSSTVSVNVSAEDLVSLQRFLLT
uniref:Dynein associated protein domain-containing protein n=1 Tax=Grammatophora oceanica TaxID=210454 RepID=A0A7S1YIV4_9STRA